MPCRLASLVLPMLMFGILLQACQSSAYELPNRGRIAWPTDGDVWVFELASRHETRLTNLARQSSATAISWSPDGQRIAYARRGPGGPENLGGSDLIVANADGRDSQIFAERDATNVFLDTPQWTRSGALYYTTWRYDGGGRQQVAITRSAQQRESSSVVDNAYYPSLSPDEATLVFVRRGRQGEGLWKQPTEGGQACSACWSSFACASRARGHKD